MSRYTCIRGVLVAADSLDQPPTVWSQRRRARGPSRPGLLEMYDANLRRRASHSKLPPCKSFHLYLAQLAMAIDAGNGCFRKFHQMRRARLSAILRQKYFLLVDR